MNTVDHNRIYLQASIDFIDIILKSKPDTATLKLIKAKLEVIVINLGDKK